MFRFVLLGTLLALAALARANEGPDHLGYVAKPYASMPLCLYASMPLCLYASMHLCIYASMHLCIYASMHLYYYV
jgi:hypothetical protein